MLDNTILVAAKTFAKVLKKSDIYREYITQLETIKEDKDLYAKVNEFRRKNYELQLQEPTGDMLDKVDHFEQEYETIIENPVVSEFLRAEYAFCRMMQKVNVSIAQELDFE